MTYTECVMIGFDLFALAWAWGYRCEVKRLRERLERRTIGEPCGGEPDMGLVFNVTDSEGRTGRVAVPIDADGTFGGKDSCVVTIPLSRPHTKGPNDQAH